jgi:uncharacterized protein YneF (UPF0154 family)
MKISDRYIRAKIQRHLRDNTPISAEAIKLIKEFLEREVDRICECGVKEFMSQNEYRKTPKRRLPGSVFKRGSNT